MFIYVYLSVWLFMYAYLSVCVGVYVSLSVCLCLLHTCLYVYLFFDEVYHVRDMFLQM